MFLVNSSIIEIPDTAAILALNMFSRFQNSILFVAACVTCVLFACAADRRTSSTSILFAPGVGYELNGKFVSTNLVGLIEQLHQEMAAKKNHAKVTVLLDETASFSDFETLRGVIQKIGFLNVRYFCLSEDKKMMAEIVMNRPAVPFSRDPQ